MFGLFTNDCPKETWEEMIENNVDEYIESFLDDMEYWDNQPIEQVLKYRFHGKIGGNIMKITNEMVTELNKELVNKGCPFRYEYDEAGYKGNPHIKITLPSMNCVDSFIINPTKEFFNWLELWFRLKGVILGRNNDGGIMWSNNGWSDITDDLQKVEQVMIT